MFEIWEKFDMILTSKLKMQKKLSDILIEVRRKKTVSNFEMKIISFF